MVIFFGGNSTLYGRPNLSYWSAEYFFSTFVRMLSSSVPVCVSKWSCVSGFRILLLDLLGEPELLLSQNHLMSEELPLRRFFLVIHKLDPIVKIPNRSYRDPKRSQIVASPAL